jgi:peptide/nickel transport system ATP-binding protein/oligopeptide transport system ATP-binding protein
MGMPILEVKGLKRYFHGHSRLPGGGIRWVKALDGVSLEVRKGETFGLVGESGCGKSTLGKTILGIYRPTEGSVTFKGNEISHLSRREAKRIRKDIQYVYQDPASSLDPYWKVGKILSEPLMIHTSLSREEIRTNVRKMLDHVGLREEHLSLYPHEFSGGQQRRLGLARILGLNPSLIILDEPTSGLDVSVQATILKLFLELKARFDLTYIFISHNLSVVRMMCNRMAVMYAGKIVEMGETRGIFKGPVHPYTKVLLAAIPEIGKKAEEKKEMPLSGEPPNPENFPEGCRFWPRCSVKMAVCESVEPPLETAADGRKVACHLYANPGVSASAVRSNELEEAHES